MAIIVGKEEFAQKYPEIGEHASLLAKVYAVCDGIKEKEIVSVEEAYSHIFCSGLEISVPGTIENVGAYVLSVTKEILSRIFWPREIGCKPCINRLNMFLQAEAQENGQTPKTYNP